MKVLVACEASGVVREAFRRRGHDAWSCDIEPAEDGSIWHIRDDARSVLTVRSICWDLMIAHPPCRYLSRAGAAWTHVGDRMVQRELAMQFFMEIVRAPIGRICVENSEGYPRHAYRPPDQVVNPFEFGHDERKKTLLWLKNLPPLFATMIHQPEKPRFTDRGGKRRYFVDAMPDSKNRRQRRSRTFHGIAEAMAEQWGTLCPTNH